MPKAPPHPLSGSPSSVVMAGDWHGDVEHARSVIDWAAGHGAVGVVQLGDFGVWPGSGGRRYLDSLNGSLRQRGLWLAFVDGNHEDHPQILARRLDDYGARPMQSHIWHLPRGLRWTWHNRKWLALGGATSLDRAGRRLGLDWWPEEALTMRDVTRALEGGSVDVMLTHDCPAGVAIPHLDATLWSRDAIREAEGHRRLLRVGVDVLQPRRLWHGHFHVRYDALLHGEGYTCHVTGLNDNIGPWRQNVVQLQWVDGVAVEREAS